MQRSVRWQHALDAPPARPLGGVTVPTKDWKGKPPERGPGVTPPTQELSLSLQQVDRKWSQCGRGLLDADFNLPVLGNLVTRVTTAYTSTFGGYVPLLRVQKDCLACFLPFTEIKDRIDGVKEGRWERDRRLRWCLLVDVYFFVFLSWGFILRNCVFMGGGVLRTGKWRVRFLLVCCFLV